MKSIDQSLFQKVLTEIGDDASPKKESGINQAVKDLNADITVKKGEISEVKGKIRDIDDLIDTVELNGDPAEHLLIQILMIRRRNLMLDIEKLGNVTTKMEKKCNTLADELNVVLWNRNSIEILKGRFK